MRLILVAIASAVALGGLAHAQPPAAAPAAAPAPKAKFGPESTFRELIANPEAKKMLYEQIPLIMAVFDQGLFEDSATLRIVSEDSNAQTGGGFTAEVYAKLLADLAKL